MKQEELFRNWHGREVTAAEYDVCESAYEWSVDWDLPVPSGIEEAYEESTGKSCVYWCPECCTAQLGNPCNESLPRTGDYVTNGYTESFYAWLEHGIFHAVCEKRLTDVQDIWNSIKEG